VAKQLDTSVGRGRLLLRLFVLFLRLRVLLLGLLGWRVRVLDGASASARASAGGGLGAGAGFDVTLDIGLMTADTVDTGATTDPVPTLTPR
jgi:hypothetical protein